MADVELNFWLKCGFSQISIYKPDVFNSSLKCTFYPLVWGISAVSSKNLLKFKMYVSQFVCKLATFRGKCDFLGCYLRQKYILFVADSSYL